MNTKRFEYFHKDIKQLKKDIAFRVLFSFIFLVTFVWQIVAMVTVSIKGSLSIMQGVIAAIVLICSLMLCLVTMSYAFKDFRIIAAIKMKGKCVSSVKILFKTEKTSFLWLYNFIMQFLTLATTLVLIACVTYSILQVTYLATISYYMPFLLMICTSGYNSIYQVRDEILTQKNVQQQQPLY